MTALMLTITLTSVPGFSAEKEKQSINSSKQKIDENKEKIDALAEEQKKVNKKIDELKELKADTASYITALDKNMTEITNELIAVNASIAQKQLDIQFTQEQLAAATQTASDQYASMKLRIKFMYEKGDTNFIDMILNATSWSDLLNKAEYIHKITKYDRTKLSEFEETKQLVTDTQTQLQAENAQLADLQAQELAKQQSIQALLDQKTAELTAYNRKISKAQSEIAEQQDKIDDLNADIRAQEANIEAMEREIERQEEEARKKAKESGSSQKTRTMTGGFTWPVPSSSRISSEFGSRESPTEGASTYHKGIDIAASTGSNVIAAAGGKVVIATYSASAGNYIMISHGSSTYTVYMHMSKLNVSEGDEVSQGDVIGAVGSTGYSTGPHLHFGIRKDGTYVNPGNYL
ncbi:Murein DD-endopeptidase MepM and murein hydrolase activator NlpD, contain LysM domain [Oribacterium sp. WCC10]|nr:Murein DD-endopeptidase MepM and murein hydrolase activator NlpD, contain LysM domain [Oribacterium sp. WCC10]